MANKHKGYTPYKTGSFAQPGKTPYKFLGKLVKGVVGGAGKLVGGVLGAGAKLLGAGGGAGGGGGQVPPWLQQRMEQGMIPGMGAMGMLNKHAAFMKRGGRTVKEDSKENGNDRTDSGFMPHADMHAAPFMKKGSPLKTDAILVKGAYDAASGKGTTKYGNIAPARAYTDMVNSVEMTVNRSSKAQLQKDRRRAKRTMRSHDRFADWAERYDRREWERDRHKQNRRAMRDEYRANVWDKPPTYYADYGLYGGNQASHPHGQYGYYWGQGAGGSSYTKKDSGYAPYTKPDFKKK